MDGFSPSDVHRAFRKFNDLAGELACAGISSWRGLLKRLLHHCTTDPVMRVVSEPLRTRSGVDVNGWYESSMQHRTYELPCDDDECLALLYQFLEAVNNRDSSKIDETIFANEVLGGTTPDDEYRRLSQHFVAPFARDVGYRLRDILNEIADRESVPVDILRIFGGTTSNVNIHGDVIGSAVGSGASLVADSLVAFKEAVSQFEPDLRDTLIKARQAADDVELPVHDKEDLLYDLRKLVDALNAPQREPTRVRRYWCHIKEIAPTVANILSSAGTVAQFLR